MSPERLDTSATKRMRDKLHAVRRNALRDALTRDVMRQDFGYRPRAFRDTLRALLTPDTRRPFFDPAVLCR